MTASAPAGTSTAPTVRGIWAGTRAPLAVVAALVLCAVLLALLRSPGERAALDPGSYGPGGSRAVARQLESGGVAVRVVGDLPALRAELGTASTVLVPHPRALTADELRAVGELPADVVVVQAGPDELAALGLRVRATPDDVDVRAPACDLPAARLAGAAVAGGVTYAPEPGVPAVGCYARGGRAAVLALPGDRTTLLGAPEPFTNRDLDEEGNAALVVNLLGGGDEVLWLLPRADRPVPGGRPTLRDLLPDAVPLALLQIGVAVVLLALVRGRRLGRVVTEPLPVVVRAAETVEGRGRLYRAAGARATAADALRAGARDRLSRRLGLGPDVGREGVVGAVAARTGRAPADVDALLYGPPPDDDRALVRLADALDALAPPRVAAPGSPHPPPPQESEPRA